MIKIQSNKQSEYEHTLQTKENENETSIGIGDQKDQSRFAQEQIQQKMRQPIPKRQPRFMYQGFFHGYCYYCSNFGHKVANYAFKFTSVQLRMPNNDELLQHRTRQSLSNQQLHTTQFTTERRTHNRHTNPFDLFYNEP